MIVETIVWLIFSVFIVFISALKTKHFMKERRFKKYQSEYIKLKNQPTITKTIDDKKEYLRQKTEGGNDILQMIISTIMFLVLFSFLIYRNVPNFKVGLIAALISSLTIAWIFTKLQFSGIIKEYKFIDSFIGYCYASTFLVYVKFIHSIPSIILLLLSIIIMIIVNKKINKWVGNDA